MKETLPTDVSYNCKLIYSIKIETFQPQLWTTAVIFFTALTPAQISGVNTNVSKWTRKKY